MNKFRALVLVPPAFAGTMTGVAVHLDPPTTAFDIATFFVMLVVIAGGSAAVLARMWRRPAGRLYWGLSRVAWLLLVVEAYLARLILLLAA